jgi:hypothetical protein
MIRKIAEEIAGTVSYNLQMARLRLSNSGRQNYQDGFTAGYRAGRAQADLGRPKIPSRGTAGHPQVEVEGIEVDELMAPLLLALWRLGMDTQFSCQGDPDRFFAHDHLFAQNRAQIVFSDFDEACTVAKETMELLDSSLFMEGGIQVASMLELDDTSFRAAVTFPPQMLARITEVWVNYEESVRLSRPVEGRG